MKYYYIYISSNASYEFLEHALQPYLDDRTAIRRITQKDITHHRILQENKNDILALFLPGARSSQIYHDDLNGDGVAAIKDYVENGGSYVGICAGAYLACSYISYQGPEIAKQGKHYHLDLFNGTAIGELSHLYTDPQRVGHSWHSVIPVRIDTEERQQPVMLAYWRGPYYQPHPHEKVDILAHYHDVVLQDGSKAIAVAAKNHGKGKAVFCGMHPELSGFVLAQSPSARFIDLDDGSCRLDLAKTLQEFEHERVALFHKVMQTALDTERGAEMMPSMTGTGYRL